MGKPGRTRILLLLLCIVADQFAPPMYAADLHPETVAAYDHYVLITETRMEEDLRDDHFLYLDRLPAARRQEIDAQIRRGEPYIEQLHTLENGSPIPIPSGLINHWVGITFIPGVTYSQVLHVLLDFDKERDIYKPDVQQSKLLSTDGTHSKVYLQYYKKSLVTVVLNAYFDATYRSISNERAEIRSNSTRIVEVENAGQPDEHELPEGKDHGYMWRLNSYWRVEAGKGGVYLQVESIALSRRVPVAIAWLINPIIRSLARAVIANLLNATRKAVVDSAAPAANLTGVAPECRVLTTSGACSPVPAKRVSFARVQSAPV